MLLDYLPIAIYLFVAVGFGAVVVFLSTILGPRTPSRVKLETYECGMEPIGPNRVRFAVKFYIIAMLFIVFDIEAVFLFPWAVVFRDLGLFGFIEMAIFILILFAGLAYVWRKGALEWD
jgi:NADH-quinone oxidoreductase subunit A